MSAVRYHDSHDRAERIRQLAREAWARGERPNQRAIAREVGGPSYRSQVQRVLAEMPEPVAPGEVGESVWEATWQRPRTNDPDHDGTRELELIHQQDVDDLIAEVARLMDENELLRDEVFKARGRVA